jgi:lipopolysaccharide/colanic/teichoic acid biosynthesis glycosyltransferase
VISGTIPIVHAGISPPPIPKQKRLFDLLLAIPGFMLLSPLLLVLGLLVRIFQGAPIFFCQRRPGYLGKPFTVYKFRTMTESQDGHGNLLPDAQRLTRLGLFLRATSLDELPNLINVLRGEMSLVGPRPLLMEYLERYTPEQARRHHVLPGMTGWAQVNGRNALTWEDKFRLDTWYVDHWSLGLDIRVLWLTIWKALRREGINQEGYATSPEFMGTPNERGDKA